MIHDETLYCRYLGGDESGLRELLERHGSRLTFYINGYIHDIHDAEDLMLEAFTRMITKKPHLREGGFRTYLYKTARHIALRFSAKKRLHHCFGFDETEIEIQDETLLEKVVQTAERGRILHLCMEKLNPDYREVLYLIYFENMCYAEAALIMGKNEKQIDNLIQRGKKALRPLLEQEGITDAYA